MESGDVTDAGSLAAWVGTVLRHGSGRSDAILLRLAHRAAPDPAALREVATLGLAVQAGRERLAETVGQGNAFRLAAASWGAEALAAVPGDLPYPVAVGALAAAHAIGEDAVCAAYLQAFASNLISAAVRLVPLGQSAGLAVLAGLGSVISAVSEETRGAGEDDLGGCTFRSDLAAMKHETQYTRLFRS